MEIKRFRDPIGYLAELRISVEGIIEPPDDPSVERDAVITLATEKTDDQGLDQIVIDGIDFEPFQKNPVFGYDHGPLTMRVPIGNVTEIIPVAGERLDIRWRWVPRGISDKIDLIHNLWNLYFIHASSIWVRIMQWHSVDPDNIWGAWVLDKTVLREGSLVYLPADWNATAPRLVGEPEPMDFDAALSDKEKGDLRTLSANVRETINKLERIR